MISKNNGEGCHPHQLHRNLYYYLKDFDFIKPLQNRQRAITRLIVTSRHGCMVKRFDTGIIGDHVLPNTMRDIGLRDEITVSRSTVSFLARNGLHCSEYWLEPDQIERAEVYLMQLVKPRAER